LRRRQSIGISKMLNDTLTIASTPLKLNPHNAEKLIPSLSTLKRKSICLKRSRLPIKQCLINKKSSKNIKDIFASQFDINDQELFSFKSLIQASPPCMRSHSDAVEVHLMDSNNDEDLASNYTINTTNTTVNLIASAILDQRSNNRLSLGSRSGTVPIDRNGSYLPLDVDKSSTSPSNSSNISAQGKLINRSFTFGSPHHHQMKPSSGSTYKPRLSSSARTLLSPMLMRSDRQSISATISNQDNNHTSLLSSSSPVGSSPQDFKLQPKSQPGSIAKLCGSTLHVTSSSSHSSSSRLDHLLRISTMDGMIDLHDTSKAPGTPIQLSVDKMKALIGSMRKTSTTPFKHELQLPGACNSPKGAINPFNSRQSTPKTAGTNGGFDFGLGFSNNKAIKTISPRKSKEFYLSEGQLSPMNDGVIHSLSSSIRQGSSAMHVAVTDNDTLELLSSYDSSSVRKKDISVDDIRCILEEVPPTLTKKLFVGDGTCSPQKNDQDLDISIQSLEFYSPRPYATDDIDIADDSNDDDDDGYDNDDGYSDLINSSVYLSGPNIDDSLSEDFHAASIESPKVMLSTMTVGSMVKRSGQSIVRDTISPPISLATSTSSEKVLKTKGFQRYLHGTPVALRVPCERIEVDVGTEDNICVAHDDAIIPAEISKEDSLCSKVLKSPTLKSVSVSNLIRRFQMQKYDSTEHDGGKEMMNTMYTSFTKAPTVYLHDKLTLPDAAPKSSEDQKYVSNPQLSLQDEATCLKNVEGSSSIATYSAGIATPSSVLAHARHPQERATRSKVRFVGIPLTPQSCQDSMKQESHDHSIESSDGPTVDIVTPVRILSVNKPISITRTRSSVRLQRRGSIIPSEVPSTVDPTITSTMNEEIKENVIDGCSNLISPTTSSIIGTPLAQSKMSSITKNNRSRTSIKPCDDTPFTKSIKCLIDEVNCSIKGDIDVDHTNAASRVLNNSSLSMNVDDNLSTCGILNKQATVVATPQIKARRLDRKKQIDELVGTCNDLIHMIDASI